MATKYLDNTGLAYFWGKIKSWVTSRGYITSSGSITGNAATATRLAGPKHSYTTAANAAKNWYRIANANTSQTDTTKPIHAQFILTAYNTSYDAGYYERWFVNAEVFGRTANIIIFGNAQVPFSQARILYEDTVADLDSNDRPAIDIYLNYVLANGTTKIEIEEVYNQGWTFVADGQISVSTIPTGFESVPCDSLRSNGVGRSTYSDYTTYIGLLRSDITSNITLADNNTYRSKVLNCTGTITVTVPSINSTYSWFVIKNFNTTSGVITVHPSTTSVLIDGSNADIKLQPGEYIVIHSRTANSYSIIGDGRRYDRCIVSIDNRNNYPFHRIAYIPVVTGSWVDRGVTFLISKDFQGGGYGIARVIFRTNNVASQEAQCSVQWLSRTSDIAANAIQVGFVKIAGASYLDVFYHSDGTYHSAICRVLAHANVRNGVGRGFTIVSASTEVSNTTATDPKTSVESYKTIANAGTAIHNQAYTDIIAASDVGVVGTANTCSGNAATASAVAWSGVTNKPTTISGYGITDAKIANGTITLGSNSITPITSHQTLPTLSKTDSGSGNAVTAISVSNHAITVTKGSTFAVDSGVVHLSGTETINGVKKFTSTMYNISNNPMYIARNTFLTKGTSVSSLYTSWLVLHCDSQATDTFTPEARIGGVHYTQETNDAMYTSLIQYSKDSGANEVYAALHVGYDANGVAFARAPSTSSSRSHGEDIVTRNWIPNDSRIVHTSGDETIGGSKYFSSAASANRFFYARHLGVKLGDTVSEDTTAAFCVLGSDGYRMAEVEYAYRTDGSVDVKLAARKNASQSSDRVQIRVGYDASGNAYTYAPTPAAADDSSRIATTEWVRDATGDFACNAATAAKLKAAKTISLTGDVTGSASFDGSANASITATVADDSHNHVISNVDGLQTALDAKAADSGVVHTTGDESVSGVKTLGSELIRNGVFVKSNAAAGAVTILGGVNANSASGAKADIYGASNATYAGGIRLQPGKTGAYKQMILLPDGTATWNGQAIQTSSDERLKTPLSAVPDAVLDAWGDVQWGQFQFLEAVQEKGESARLHLGLIAQRVKVAFEAHGLDACAYGILCHDVREATEDEPAADLWTVRYAEALAMESAYQRRRADRLEARIAALEVLL